MQLGLRKRCPIMIQIGTIPINFHLSRYLQITNVLCDKKKTIHCVFVSAKSHGSKCCSNNPGRKFSLSECLSRARGRLTSFSLCKCWLLKKTAGLLLSCPDPSLFWVLAFKRIRESLRAMSFNIKVPFGFWKRDTAISRLAAGEC